LRAELSDVSDLAFAPNGTLYIADGGRVRVVGRGGIIRTIIGKMRTNPLSIAISPSGQLYISTSATPSASSQILRLTGRDTLATVRPVVLFGPLRGQRLDSFGPIAIDARGTIDIAGFNGWSTWRVAPGGDAREVGPGSGARRSGGGYSVLERAPNGAVYAENGSTLLRLSDLSLVPTFTFRKDFWLTYFAFAPSGAIYADEIPGNTGFEEHQQLLFVSHGHTSLLWQESNRAPK
jgi:hypothetical protein